MGLTAAIDYKNSVDSEVLYFNLRLKEWESSIEKDMERKGWGMKRLGWGAHLK